MLDLEAYTGTSVAMTSIALKKKLLLNITINVARTTRAGKPNSSSANTIPTM